MNGRLDGLERAGVDIKTVELCIDCDDEGMYDSLTYYLQQSVSKCIKYVYVCRGVAYKYVHSFSVLIDGLPEDCDCIPDELKDLLYTYGPVLDSQESRTRYKGTVLTTRRNIVDMLELAKRLYAAVEGCEFTPKRLDEPDSPRECKLRANKNKETPESKVIGIELDNDAK